MKLVIHRCPAPQLMSHSDKKTASLCLSEITYGQHDKRMVHCHMVKILYKYFLNNESIIKII
jgi:hypothetical protein